MDKVFGILITLFVVIAVGHALECYSCESQRNNRERCIRNFVRCSQFQDACVTYVRWGVPEEWTARTERIYFISKGCDTRQGCEKRQSAMQTSCNRNWYNDWACVDCCTGDLCNYYVTLGAGTVKASFGTLISIATGLVLLRWL